VEPKTENEMAYTKIELKDFKSEVNYWETAVGCCVLGASPPYSVLSGFIMRI